MSETQALATANLSEAEKQSLEKLYRAFNDRNPDLLDEACCPDWEDIPLAPGQEPGPSGFKKLMPLFFFQAPSFLQVLLRGPLLQRQRFPLIFQAGKLVVQQFFLLGQLALDPLHFGTLVFVVGFQFGAEAQRFFAGLDQQFFLAGLRLRLEFSPFRFYFRSLLGNLFV